MEDHEKNNNKQHAFLIPFPLQGHISPMFNVAKLLHGRGFHVTFVNTEFCHRKLLSSHNNNNNNGVVDDEIHDLGLTVGGRFKFAIIPSTDFDIIQSRNHEKMVHDVKTKFLAPVNALINEINESASEDGDGEGEGEGAGVPPITCIVSDPMMIFSIDVAKEFGIPLLLFFVFSASTLLTFPCIPKLVQNGVLPIKGIYIYIYIFKSTMAVYVHELGCI